MDEATLEVMAAANDEDLNEIIDDLTHFTPEELRDEMDRYLLSIGNRKRNRDSTNIQHFIDWMAKNNIESVSDHEIRMYIRDKVEEGYAKNTLKSHYYSIVNFSDDRLSAVSTSLIRDVNWSDTVDSFTDDEEQKGRLGKGVRPITESEKDAMREVASARNELLTELLWQTGLRAKEAANIKISDINLTSKNIKVKTAKRKKHTRVVSINNELYFMLDEYLDVTRPKYGKSSKYLWVSNSSEKPQPHNLTRSVRELADEAGIQEYDEMQNGAQRARIAVHSFRKALGIRLDEQGASMKEIAETLGHSNTGSVSTYLDID
ncbi:Site-specific recombinase XerD [Halobaculum gomorrense]|uniref:Site-specific recombinase XerD n=2 Tax=Halobaculum gomorrense TaxID=43928 RepID=A0A1M5S2W9_9EURY|nr:Site-specific recombinase XerD [Halobaculum gomorrense]